MTNISTVLGLEKKELNNAQLTISTVLHFEGFNQAVSEVAKFEMDEALLGKVIASSIYFDGSMDGACSLARKIIKESSSWIVRKE